MTLDPADYATSHTISSLDDCWDVPSSSLTTTFVKWYSCHGGTNQQVRIVPTTVGGRLWGVVWMNLGIVIFALVASLFTNKMSAAAGMALRHWYIRRQ